MFFSLLIDKYIAIGTCLDIDVTTATFFNVKAARAGFIVAAIVGFQGV